MSGFTLLLRPLLQPKEGINGPRHTRVKHQHIPGVASHARRPRKFRSPDRVPGLRFGPEADYISLKDAISKGLTAKELPGGGSVRDLVVQNPSRHNVLVFEGEEVLGAQQNRTFDISVLVPGGSQLPVSCVEAGRWDGSRNVEAFTSSPQTSSRLSRELGKRVAIPPAERKSRQVGSFKSWKSSSELPKGPVSASS